MNVVRGKHQCPAVHTEHGRCDRKAGHPLADANQTHWVRVPVTIDGRIINAYRTWS